MKRILPIVFISLILLVSCGSNQSLQDGWHEDVFASEFFGISFALPFDWYDEPQNGRTLGDRVVMYAESPVLGGGWFHECVQLSYWDSEMTAEDYLAYVLASNIAEIAGDEPLRALQIQDHATRIGRYDWLSFSYWGLDGGFARVFVRRSDVYMQQILILHGAEPSLEHILELFSPPER